MSFFGGMGQSALKNLGNGGTMDGDVTVTGDLTVNGGIALTLSEVLQGTSTIDVNSTEALLVRKNGDGGDIFIVDTVNSKVIATELDISGNVDIDGTLNVDALDIDGALQLDNTLTVGVNDTGYDVKFFGATAGQYFLWDESADELVLGGDSKLSFHDASGGENIIASADGHLEINAGTTLDITAPTVDINGAVDISGSTTITTADNTDTLTLISTDADNNAGAYLNIYRNSASPADNDQIGQITFTGRNDNSQDVDYARIITQIKDASDGSELGRFAINTMVAGGMYSRLNVMPTETVFNDESVDLDFRIESDANTHALFLEGSTGNVGIGTASPDYKLKVEESTNGADCSIAIRALNDGGAGRTALLKVDPDAQTLTLGVASIVTDISNERVGIGTTSPNEGKLVVQDSTKAELVIKTSATATDTEASLMFKISTDTIDQRKKGGIIYKDVGDNGIGDMFFVLDSATDNGSATVADNAVMTLKNNGQVLIGGTTDLGFAPNVVVEGTQPCLALIKDADAFFNINVEEDTVSMFYDHAKKLEIGHAVNSGGTTFTPNMILDVNSRISLSNNDSNTNNTVFGYSAFNTSSNNASDGNTVFGNNAMGTGTVAGASLNTAIGNLALTDITSGVSNIALGSEAGANITIGKYNIAIGTNTLITEDVGDGTTAVGIGAGGYQNSDSNNEATGNSLFGFVAGEFNVTGTNNTYLGYQSGKGALNQSNSSNTGVGKDSLLSITTGGSNTAIGAFAGDAITTQSNCVLIGRNAGTSINHNDADGTTIVGRDAGENLESSIGTTLMGYSAGINITTGDYNTAIGYQAGSSIVDSSNNTAIGYQSMVSLVRLDTRNVALGNYSMDAHTENAYNVAIGYNSLTAMKAGNTGTIKATYNTAVGYQAGDALVGGYSSGGGDPADEGMHNTFIGAETDASAVGGNNQTVVGYGATGQADNSVTLGNASVTAVYMAQDSGAIVHTAGIQFPASQVANGGANVLDDYEEGTWTPAFKGAGGSAGSVDATGSGGTYTKVGRQVHMRGRVDVVNVGSYSGNIQIQGIPFTASGSASDFHGTARLAFVTLAGHTVIARLPGGGNTIDFPEIISGGQITLPQVSEAQAGGNTAIIVEMTYTI